jgi:hypothetical protein
MANVIQRIDLMDKVKRQVIKQVWRVKKDWNVKKSSDLTLEDKKWDSHKLANIVYQSWPKQDLVVQKPHSTRGQGVEKKKKVKSMLSFAELLAKYKREIKQKKESQLGDKTRGQKSSSPARPKVSLHYQLSSNWSSSYIPSMHAPWTTYLGNHNTWSWHHPWSPCYYYQHPFIGLYQWINFMIGD